MFRKPTMPVAVFTTLFIAALVGYGTNMAMSANLGLGSDPMSAAVARAPVMAAPAAQQPPAPPAQDLFALNHLAAQERGGVRLEVARVVIGRKDLLAREGRSLASLGQLRGDAVVGELILKVTNIADRKVAVPVDEGTVLIGDEQIRYQSGDENAGYLLPGGTRITSHLFVISRSQVRQVRNMVVRVGSPVDAGNNRVSEDFVLAVDLSRQEYQPRKIKGP